MSWRLAHSLAQLRTQVNAAAPGRNKRSDGTIGDLAHSRTNSEHNPNPQGVVRAIDITHDPAGGCNGHKLAADAIAELDRRGIRAYVIFDGRIRSTYVARGVWRRYTGSNPHPTHVHISVLDGYDSRRVWDLPRFAAPAVVSMGGGMTAPIGGVRVQAKTVTSPAWPLPSKHLIGRNPHKRSTWHDGYGNDTTGRAAIKRFQQRLRDRGWSVTVDGYYGPDMVRLVAAFQRDQGLAVDSIVGPATWRAAWTNPIT